MKKNTLYVLTAAMVVLVLLCCVPIAPHDWGDDFAMYILQAKKYAFSASTGSFVYNAQAPMYAPPSYPPGFPLVLMPVYSIFGVNLEVFQYYMCMLLVLSALAVFGYTKKIQLPVLLSLIIVLLLCFHPFNLELKQEILSDIPFMGWVFLFLYLHTKQKPWYFIALAATAALLTRSTGVLLIMAWGAEIFFILLFERNEKEKLLNNLKGFGLLAVTTLTLTLIFPIISGYSGAWTEVSVSQTMYDNFYMYKAMFEAYFMELFNIEESTFKFLSWPLFLLFLLGAYFLFRNKHRLPVIWFIVYLLLILSYPYKWGGNRMLFPLMTFMWIFIFAGVHFLCQRIKWQQWIYAAITITLLVPLALRVDDFTHKKYPRLHYAETPESKELFKQINAQTNVKYVIAGAKPRAMALFTGRACMFVQPDITQLKTLPDFLRERNVRYLVTMKNNPHLTIDTLATDTTFSELLWNNSMYALYHIKD